MADPMENDPMPPPNKVPKKKPRRKTDQLAPPPLMSVGPPVHDVCPTCHRPWPSPREKQEEKKATTAAAVAHLPEPTIFACPFLPPELLRPVKKYPKKYLPFVSGQNSSAPSKFFVVPAEALIDNTTSAAAPPAESAQSTNVYDELAIED